MGRPGRYTLAVMVWVAAFAGWSSLVGLVIAAATGSRPKTVSVGTSALLTVIGPLVPTLAALWFNDWARDGFPSRADRQAAGSRRRRRRSSSAARPAPPPVLAAGPESVPDPAPESAPEPAPDTAPQPEPVVLPAALLPAPAPGIPTAAQPGAPETGAIRVVPAAPLGVTELDPEHDGERERHGGYPVAPLLRDR